MKPQICSALLAITLILASCAGGARNKTADTSGYSASLQSRFHQAWVQPIAVASPRARISVPVEVEIDSQGRVASFKIKKPSGDPAIDDSIEAAGKRVKKVGRPPSGTPFKLRIAFELDVQ